MDILAAINARASAATLAEPAPSREHIQSILEAGARAPDHGKLAPWRFVVIESAAREKLADAMKASLLAKNAAADEIELKRERDKVMRAPTIIAVGAKIKKGHKIPESEQLLAVGAATQNMFLAAQALGYGVMWKTGDAAYDPSIKAFLGLEADDEIVAFLYLGTTGIPGKVRAPMLDERVKWL